MDAALIATASNAWRNRAPRRTFEILNKTRAERKFLVDFLVDRFFENGGTVASIGWGEGAWRDTNGEPLRVQPRGQVAA